MCESGCERESTAFIGRTAHQEQGQSRKGVRRDCRLVVVERRRNIVVIASRGIARLVRYTILNISMSPGSCRGGEKSSPSIAMSCWSIPIASQAALTCGSFLQISSAHSSSSGWREGCINPSRTFHEETTGVSTPGRPGMLLARSTIASKLCPDVGQIKCTWAQLLAFYRYR